MDPDINYRGHRQQYYSPNGTPHQARYCLLILDEVLGLVENGIITAQDLLNLVDAREETDIILTGIFLEDEICFRADEVSKIETIKFKVWE